MGLGAILSGADIKVYINGSFLGWTQGVTYRSSTPVRAVHVVDQSTPAELIPTTLAVVFSMQVFRGRGQGSAEGLGLVPFGDEIVMQKYNSIELLDRETDTLVGHFVDCLVIEQNWNLMFKKMWMGNLTLQGRQYGNEAGI